jgi:hypothetical protein
VFIDHKIERRGLVLQIAMIILDKVGIKAVDEDHALSPGKHLGNPRV